MTKKGRSLWDCTNARHRWRDRWDLNRQRGNPRIRDGQKQVGNIGLAEGDAVPVDLPPSGSLTVELTKPIKNQYCG